jgi:hypothetical protein
MSKIGMCNEALPVTLLLFHFCPQRAKISYHPALNQDRFLGQEIPNTNSLDAYYCQESQIKK